MMFFNYLIDLFGCSFESISHLKKVSWPIRRRRPSLCVESSFQLLGILEYARGLDPGPAYTLNQNSIFEMAYSREPREIRGRARRCNPAFFRIFPEKGTLLAVVYHCSPVNGKVAEREGESEDLPGQRLKPSRI